MSVALLTNSDAGTQYRGTVVRPNTSGTCLLAQADSADHCSNLLGVRLADVSSGASGTVADLLSECVVRLSGAASAGDVIYLSAAVAGVGTNVKPAVVAVLGYAYNTYDAGGVWYAELIRQQLDVPSLGGVGGMYEYENAASMGIDQTDTYHPMWTSGVLAGTLDGWTFTAGASGTFTAVADLGGGQMRFTTGAPHGLANGRVVAITSASVAGYRPPNQTFFSISNVGASTFDVTGTFTATATGTWTAGACLTAGALAAGKYQLFWSVSARTSAGVNKTYKFEVFHNTSEENKAAANAIIDANGPSGFSGSAFITVAAGDVILLCCQNQTDATDVTIIDMNCRVLRYAA